jgi:hypothetical protein
MMGSDEEQSDTTEPVRDRLHRSVGGHSPQLNLRSNPRQQRAPVGPPR